MIDHPYIVAQIVLGIPEGGAHLPTLRRELRRSAPGSEYRQAIALTLGLSGDASVSQYLQAYARDTRHSLWLRERAVRALAEIGGPEVVPLFVQLLTSDSDYYLRQEWHKANSAIVRRYHVRESARTALRQLKRRGQSLGSAAEKALKEARWKVPAPAKEARAYLEAERARSKAMIERQLREVRERAARRRAKKPPAK